MIKKTLNCTELLDYQPNRYPFLMIDYVTKFIPGKMANGYKNFKDAYNNAREHILSGKTIKHIKKIQNV